MKIEKETLISSGTIQKESVFKQDFSLLAHHVNNNSPAFYLYRTQDASNEPDAWLFIEFIPESAHIREKLLYSASKNALLKDLGENRFSEKIYTTLAVAFYYSL